MNNIFHRFETSSRTERKGMADNLKSHYNHMIQLEREAFSAVQMRRNPSNKIAHAEIVSALGHVQAVFDILGFDYDPGQPFDLGLF